MIHTCSCKSEYQDKKYGKGNRVHNPTGEKNKNHANCTVCGTRKEGVV